MRSDRMNFMAPAACALLLIGIAFEGVATHVDPHGADAYHRAAAQAIAAIPTRIGTWSACNQTVPRQAIALLKPNAILCLRYTDNDARQLHGSDRWAILLVDQCKDARDMNGHWPPNCYVNSGEELLGHTPRTWTLDGLRIDGTEYLFRQTGTTDSTRTAVYNFLIVPREKIVPDMNGVTKAAETYKQRFLGAAQFQLVMNADLPTTERDEIFATLLSPCVPAIKTLMSGGMQ